MSASSKERKILVDVVVRVTRDPDDNDDSIDVDAGDRHDDNEGESGFKCFKRAKKSDCTHVACALQLLTHATREEETRAGDPDRHTCGWSPARLQDRDTRILKRERETETGSQQH